MIPAEPFVTARHRSGPPTEVVIHESETTSEHATDRVLRRKGYGVHVSIDGDGSVYQHNPWQDRLIHCAGHNGVAIGIEVTNPYLPKYAKPPWIESIDAPWAHGGRYMLPPLAQLEALVEVLRGILADPELAVPDSWRGLGPRDRWQLQHVPWSRRAPGIWTHQQIGHHADGGFPGLVAFLALGRGFAVDSARARAAELAAGARYYVQTVTP